MPQQKKGLFVRMLEGNERSAECARSALPESRYQLFKDIFSGNFGKIVKINLLMLLFFTPMIVIAVLSVFNSLSYGFLYPFGSNLGIGYPAVPELGGLSQVLTLQNGLYTCLGILLASVLASVGLAGGMYAIRNMIWTQGVFVAKDFWRGVKLNYKNALQTSLFFTTILTLALAIINVGELNIALGATDVEIVFLRISQVIAYILLALSAMMALWMVALGVNYKMGFFTLLKNAFLMSVAMIPQTVFFGAVAILPFAIFLLVQFSSIFLSLGLAGLIFLAFSFALLVWLSFAQWVFDQYINPKTQHIKQENGEEKAVVPHITGDDSASMLEYQRSIVEAGKSRLMSQPIKPLDDGFELYELPKSFTRADLKKLKENKQALAEEVEAYADAHKDDARFVEYNEQFDARERALQEQETKQGKKNKRAKKTK